ncbi:MAG: lyase family protein [Pseudomonadota bacterium]
MKFLASPIVGDEEMAAIFSDAQLWTRLVSFEVALAKVQGGLQVIPEAAAEAIVKHAPRAEISLDKLSEGVSKAGVPVPVLVASLRDATPAPHDDWIHWGATSQDVVDTALVLSYSVALDIVRERLVALIDQLEKSALEYADVPMLARTRGQLATPISLGLRVAQWAQPLIGLESELQKIRHRTLRVQFGGASGSQSAIAPHGPAVAKALAAELNLAPSAPWHTDRGGIVALTGWLQRLTTALGKIGRDLALSGRGEVGELGAGEGGGSSTMPHKSNPVGAEALQTIALVANGLAAGLSAASLHTEERDGAAWPVEWVFLPQLFEVVGAGLRQANDLASDLRPDPERMAARIADVPEVMAEAVVFALAPNLGRREAERRVKDGLAGGKRLDVILSEASEVSITAETVLGLRPSLDAAKAIIDEIFASRG